MNGEWSSNYCAQLFPLWPYKGSRYLRMEDDLQLLIDIFCHCWNIDLFLRGLNFGADWRFQKHSNGMAEMMSLILERKGQLWREFVADYGERNGDWTNVVKWDNTCIQKGMTRLDDSENMKYSSWMVGPWMYRTREDVDIVSRESPRLGTNLIAISCTIKMQYKFNCN